MKLDRLKELAGIEEELNEDEHSERNIQVNWQRALEKVAGEFATTFVGSISPTRRDGAALALSALYGKLSYDQAKRRLTSAIQAASHKETNQNETE